MANGLPPETDVVVVGSGMAGLAAALSAAELGLRATLLEKSTLDPSWSNSRISNGAVHPCMIDVKSPPETIVERLKAITDGVTRSDLARAFAADTLLPE